MQLRLQFNRSYRPQGAPSFHGRVFGIVATLLFIAAPQVFAADATLYLSPVTGQYTVGETVAIKAKLSSGGALVNAVEGKLIFDPKAVEIVSIDRTRSIVTSWTDFPVAPPGSSEIRFGGSLGTSTVVDQGELFTLMVRPLRSDTFRIEYDSGSATAIHAADGTGGNIVAELRNGGYMAVPDVISPEVATPAPTPEPEVSVPVAAVSSDEALPPAPTSAATPSGEVLGATTDTKLVSSTHPDQSRWYPTTTAEFSWGNEKDMTQLLLGVGKKPVVKGSVSYKPFIESKSIPNLQDGVWYFHITKIFGNGDERTEHYRINVDTTAPVDFSVSEVERSDPTNPAVEFTVTATDTTSGIDHYSFSVDGGAPEVWKDSGEHLYRLTVTDPGDHKLTAEAYDGAGNKTTATITFSVKALPPPTITSREESYAEGDKLALDIHSVPNANIVLSIAANGGAPITESVVANGNGDATFTGASVLLSGEYRIVATGEDARGARTLASDPFTTNVHSTIVGMLKRHPMIPVAIIALIVLLGVGWYSVKRFRHIRSSERGEIPEDVPIAVEHDIVDAPKREQSVQSDHSVVILSEKKFTPSPRRMPITKL